MPTNAFLRLTIVAAVVAAAPSVASGQQTTPPRLPPDLSELWSIQADSALFKTPRSIVVTRDCSVWVVDPTTGVWRIPCDGGAPAQVGRLGSGTGEYEAPLFGALVGNDTVAVFDRAAQKLVYYAAGGAVVLSRPLMVLESQYGRLQDIAIQPGDGGFLAWSAKFPTPIDRTQSAHVLALRADGMVRDSVLRLAPLQSVTYDSSFASGRFDAPFQRRPFVAFFRDGGFAVGSNDEARVTIHDSSGVVRRTIMLPVPEGAAITRLDRVAYADSVKGATEREMEALHYDDSLRVRSRTEVDRLLSAITYPARRQRFDRLALDDREDVLWVLLPGGDASYARTWMACTLTELSFCRTLRVPHRGAVVAVAIRGGALYAIEQSREGISRVAKYGSK